MKKMIWVLLSGMAFSFAQPESEAQKGVSASLDAWTRAWNEKDGGMLDKLLHPDLTFGHASGLIQTKTEVVEAIMASKSKTSGFVDKTIRVYGDTAIVRGTTAQFKILHVWIKGPQGWRMVAQQTTRFK